MSKEFILKTWIVLLFLSFSYEKPIMFITSIDRINPRIFDIVALLGLLIMPIVLKKNKPDFLNYTFLRWRNLIIWFGICVAFSIFFYKFPTLINLYMIFSYVKYLQELFVLFIVVKITTKFVPTREIFKTLIIGGLFVFFYSIYELRFGQFGTLEFAPGKFIYKPEGVVWGPFGNTYFQIANFLPLTFIFSFGYATYLKGIKRVLLIILAIITIYPLFLTGSRTGLFLLGFTFIIFLLIKYKLIYTIILTFFIIITVLYNWNELMNEELHTVQRLSGMENTDFNSIDARIFNFMSFDLNTYEENGMLLPFIGGGFYVAPVNGSYRIDYGTHNIFLFAFEQAGLFGFLLFISFIFISIRILWRSMKLLRSKNNLEYIFIVATFAFFTSSLIIGMAGHTFWRGFATNNMNSLRIALIIISASLYYKELNHNYSQDEKDIIIK